MRLPGVSSMEVHRSLSSTSDRAREWIREGVRPVALVVASEQTRGRGREGRAWLSGPDEGLWMSMVLPAREPETDRLLPLRLGLALARALDAVPARAGGPRIRLKWPNDLFSDEGKVGGILCESLGDTLVVGVGLNCRAPEVDSPYPAAGLPGLEPETLLPVTVAAVLESHGDASPELGAGEIAEWRKRDLLAGTRVEAVGGVKGRAEGIDRAGRLLVVEPGGAIRAVITGSIRPGAPPTP